jgi:hypothetical protein
VRVKIHTAASVRKRSGDYTGIRPAAWAAVLGLPHGSIGVVLGLASWHGRSHLPGYACAGPGPAGGVAGHLVVVPVVVA